ncbi:MAG: ABC transporter permease [Alicyclobacillaceae bacterium]|nr:ABC transporter permease [Alicyclobacillaceae bacterium]
MNTRFSLKRFQALPSLLLVLLFVVIDAFLIPHFLSDAYASSFFTSYTPLILLTIAETVVLIGGGIDISIGSIVSLVNVTWVTLGGAGWGFWSSLVVSLLAGLAIGVLNGAVVAWLRVSPLLVTLATSSIAGGLALWIMPYPGGSASANLVTWYQATFAGIPAPLLFVVIAYLLWLGWALTPWGLRLFAMGNHMHKTYVSGVPVASIQFATYVFSALVAGIAAIAVTANTGAGDPTIGATYTLYAIAAAVIGGVSLNGGVGTAAGAIFGSIFLGLAFSTVYAANMPSFYQDLTSGAIVLCGIIFASLTKLRRRRQFA